MCYEPQQAGVPNKNRWAMWLVDLKLQRVGWGDDYMDAGGRAVHGELAEERTPTNWRHGQRTVGFPTVCIRSGSCLKTVRFSAALEFD